MRWDQTELYARRLQLLKLMALGDTNEQIARKMDLSSSTIQADVKFWFNELNANCRANVVHRAWCEGLLNKEVASV